MLPVAILLSAREIVVEAFCPVLDLLLDEPLHQILQFCTIYVMAQPEPPAASLVVYHRAPSVNIGFLPYLLRSCLKKWYSTRKRSSHGTGAWPDICVYCRLICNPQPIVNAVYLKQGFVYKYRPDEARLSVRYLSAQSAYFCTHFQTATWLLLLMGAKDLAASLKLLELKYTSTVHM